MSDENMLCPCQSGKRYHECCFLKRKLPSDVVTRKIFNAFILSRRKRKAAPKYCIHPNKNECVKKIIHAHNIQHKGILNRLAIDGYVYMPETDIFTAKLRLNQIGISNQATVFTGFCKKHDNDVFAPIEQHPFTKTDEQLFLYAYKAFSLTYYKVNWEMKINETLFNEYDFSNSIPFFYFRELTLLIQKYLELEIEKFNNVILTRNFTCMKHHVGVLQYEVDFAVSSAFEIHCDLMEKEITWFPYKGKLSLIYMSIFPDNGISYYIISYFDQEENYSGLIEQLKSIPDYLLKKYLNNLIIQNVENLVISPRLYNKWSDEQKNDFIQITQTIIENAINGIEKENYFISRSFNLFDN